jgi:hypothetical protein
MSMNEKLSIPLTPVLRRFAPLLHEMKRGTGIGHCYTAAFLADRDAWRRRLLKKDRKANAT